MFLAAPKRKGPSQEGSHKMQISQMGFGQGEDLTSPPDRLLLGAPQVPNLPPMKLKTKVTLSCPTHKVFVKASKRSVVVMAFKPTSKVAEPSRSYWSPQGQRPYGQPKWCHLLVPMW